MDLHNNAKGRDCVAWNDLFPSASTCSSRVIDKINNDEMIILVK
jgi:hypothetical protein